MKSKTLIIKNLAEGVNYLSSIKFPDDVTNVAKKLIIDICGVTLAGSNTSSTNLIFDSALGVYSSGKCTIIGKNKTLKLDHQKFCDRIFSDVNHPTIVIGWSYGGLLALKSYSSINSNIKKIFLINTNLNIMGKNNTILNPDNIAQLKSNLRLRREKTIQNFTYEVLRHSKYLKQELIMLNKICLNPLKIGPKRPIFAPSIRSLHRFSPPPFFLST